MNPLHLSRRRFLATILTAAPAATLGLRLGAAEGTFACRYLLQWSGRDHCAILGFRCVVDLER